MLPEDTYTCEIFPDCGKGIGISSDPSLPVVITAKPPYAGLREATSSPAATNTDFTVPSIGAFIYKLSKVISRFFKSRV